jgi:alkylation response protein AidB-like acyl-CoA dehydrogenase
MNAVEFADEILFPSANEVDAMPVVPRERLDLLAAEGWYGLAAPAESGGKGLSLPDAYPIIAAFAGGCFTTAFVWLQHHGAVAAVAYGPNAELRDELLEPLAQGAKRATVAFAGLLPTPGLRARPDGDAWIVDGTAPWITGWGLTDLVHLTARTPEDDVVWLLADAEASDRLQVSPLRLLAANASATVTARFEGLVVGGDRLTGRHPWSEWPDRDAAGLRTNGSLAIGVAERCCRLVGASPLDDELARRVDALDAATPDALPAARAAVSAFAVRAASALVAHEGSSSVVLGNHAERLLREATLLLVFGSRPAIRSALLHDLGAAQSPAI